MSLESVRQFFAEHAPEINIIELTESTATVTLAARAHHVEPGQIAKTLSLKVKDRVILIVTRGDARLDNHKLKEVLGSKARMLSSDEVLNWTGHPVGGVCPFGLEHPLQVLCDISLRHYEEVLPAAGSIRSAVRISPEQLAQLTNARWVDVCQLPD
ncbi:YbaK/EbsC family protein [Erwinia psidii]|uniref:YbaK/EbsC family protein n=1 Tax=Erwinia psidii TaxID=69224 RepID=A0A3N6RX01_9GAMM|nr:YbaK/EbsC family protein [Erwinia psidii]MCX8959428.1 YbaK/EbsC family protein [Erwinia psidii]MCX8962684.1 YbaK/EbsC family protein [Erwinia psidii]MCX8964280.1 YbaK/EbsC family protein [Erwinia psidii]RQM36887.1 YbaK/EbsC family protein [Erwinia psidii]